MPAYIALIRKQARSVFGVEFPDLPGCISAGKTLEEALHSASEALGLHLRGLTEDEAVIPAARTLDEILAQPEAKRALPVLVQARTAKGKAVRLNITLDEKLLEQVDEAAAARGMTRSGFLANAARRALSKKVRASRAPAA